jgi:uncharacterized protein YydD (DUF2326 family)
MFIKSLRIACDTKIIREMTFQKGINFIVDATKSSDGAIIKTGNNIGKTTVLRLIDFCLGGDEKSIYKSKEFKNNDNELIKNFLHQQNVQVTLKLQSNLEDPTSKQVEICRNFLKNSHKVLTIDGQAVLSKDLDRELKQRIFSYEGEKPTFKQLKAKNIRTEAERLENTVRVLNNYTKSEEYEALYLFWLGVNYPDAEVKRQLLDERNIENKFYQRIIKENTASKLKQFLDIVNRDIDVLEHQKDSFNLNDSYENDLNQLNEIRAQLNAAYSNQTQLELRKELIEESKMELKNNLACTDTRLLDELYKQASILLPELNKTYSETVQFHNSMIKEKINFVASEMPHIEAELGQLNDRIKTCLYEEKVLVSQLNKSDAFDELQDIITKLNKKHEEKGKLELKAEQLKSSVNKLASLDEQIAKIDQAIYAHDANVQARISQFNSYFSEISNHLYGEKFALSADFEKKSQTEQRFYKLNIDSLNGQTGTGKKKGEITAFDLAYVKFADALGIDCLHFILHDQMELVDDNQIQGLVDALGQTNCQLIVPILRDKLPIALNQPEYIALSLSQDDKLFKV